MNYQHTALSSSAKQMGTIVEDEDYIQDRETRGGASGLSRNYSNMDNENAGGNRSAYLEDSIADPGRVPDRVEGLTQFLLQEYYRSFGIYTQDI